jgi:alpha-amylase
MMGSLRHHEDLRLPKFNLVLLIHAHQPVGNFDEVMERTYERSYLPFIECVARHPRVRWQ